MSDSSPPSRRGSTGLPPAIVYDPRADEAPLGTDPMGTVVLLLVSNVDPDWAAHAAIELSAAWADQGRRIVLADLYLDRPTLHEVTGAENDEGIVDVFLYGVSISRSARPVSDKGFYLIPAGTYTADPEAVYHHSRWPKLAAGFRDAGASLVLFAPARGVDLEALAPWVSQLILLGEPADAAALAPLLDTGAELSALVEPPPPPPEPIESEPITPEDAEFDGFREDVTLPGTPAPSGDLLEEQSDEAAEIDAALAKPPTVAEFFDEELDLPPPPPRVRRRSHGAINAALWVLFGVVVLGALGYIAAVLHPGLLPGWARTAALEPSDDPSSLLELPTASSPHPIGQPLPYSVLVINYKSLDAARRQLATAEQLNYDVPFFISPEEVQGLVYYKIMAGALPDSSSARELKERLVANGSILKEDAVGVDALMDPTPYAFALGTYATEVSAQAVADSLAVLHVPAYALPVPYSDGTRLWRLYGGAFRDSANAEGMREILLANGFKPSLVPRLGLSGAQ